jgi:hypothetical protein
MVVTLPAVTVADVTGLLVASSNDAEISHSSALKKASTDIVLKLAEWHSFQFIQKKKSDLPYSTMISELSTILSEKFRYNFDSDRFYYQFLGITDAVREKYFPNMAYWMVNLYRQLIPTSHTGFTQPSATVDMLEAMSLKSDGASGAAHRLAKNLEPVDTRNYPQIEGPNLIRLKMLVPWLDVGTLFAYNGGGPMHIIGTYKSGLPYGSDMEQLSQTLAVSDEEDSIDAVLFSMFPSDFLKARDFFYEDKHTMLPPPPSGIDPIILIPANMASIETYMAEIRGFLSSFATVAYSQLDIKGNVSYFENADKMRKKSYELMHDFCLEYADAIRHAKNAAAIINESNIEPVYKFLASAGLMKGVIHLTEIIQAKVNSFMIKYTYMKINDHSSFPLDNLPVKPAYATTR